MIIGKTIKQLLEERKRVILPGFGNLEVKESGGNVPASGKQIAPPGLSIKFDSSFSKDDGVLASAFAEAGGLEKAEAEQQVLELVDAIRFSLDKGENYPLADAGAFSRNEEGKTLFQVDSSWVLEPDQYGLDSMDLLELDDLPDEKEEPSVGDPERIDSGQVQAAEEEADQEAESTEENRQEPPEPAGPEKEEKPKEKPAAESSKRPQEKPAPKVHEPWKNGKTKKRSGLWRVIWIITGILIVVLVVLMLVPAEKWKTAGKKEQAVQKEQPAEKKEQAVQEEQPAEIPGLADQSGDEEPQAEGKSDLQHEQPAVKEAEQETEPIPVESDHFFIVAGSFSNLGNASELQDKLTAMGYPAEVMVTENRMYRVSVESYATRSEAEASLARMKSEPGMESCWLLANE